VGLYAQMTSANAHVINLIEKNIMSNKQNVILRVTVNIDMNNFKEVAFTRAALRRLNVLFAKCRPKSGLKDILKEFKIRDAYEPSGSVAQVKKKSNENTLPVVVHQRNLHTVPVKKQPPQIVLIVEREIPPPTEVTENVNENTIDAEVVDTTEIS
jgi:hypothetical protein